MANDSKQLQEGVRGGEIVTVQKGVLGGLEARRGFGGGDDETDFVPPKGGSALMPAPPAPSADAGQDSSAGSSDSDSDE